ncbi:MAG: four helix bundle protein [Prevotella sp.]|nr:four helix bundle protein [Prevotella sp.]
MKESIIKNKSKDFALRIIKLYKYLTTTAETREYILSKQILRSGTSIGANVKEALRGQSRPDFRAKMNIALKEASETEYWLELLHESDYIDDASFQSIIEDNIELIKILTNIVKSTDQS